MPRLESPSEDDALRFAALRGHALRRLDSQSRRALIPYLVRQRFTAGESIHGFAELPFGLGFVLDGQLELARDASRCPGRALVSLEEGGLFGAAALAAPRRYAERAAAISEGRALLLPASRVAAADQALPATMAQLRDAARSAAELPLVEHEFIVALQRARPFVLASARQLARLTISGEILDFAAGATVAPDAPATQLGDGTTGNEGIYFVVRGRLAVVRPAGKSPTLRVGAGDVFGASEHIDGWPTLRLRSELASRLVFVPAATVRQRIAEAPGLRRALREAAR